MIYFLPIEPLEQRYTKQMLEWVSGDLDIVVGHDNYRVVLPHYAGEIKHGQFLDSFASNEFKAAQLALVACFFRDGKVYSGDLFLLGDVWFPGIEMVRMMADLAGVHIKIAGWHYAGTFDQADFYSRALGHWARRFEEMLCEHVLDAVCVGSHSHADRLAHNLRVPIYPYGLSWKPRTLPEHTNEERQNIVVFPHRLAPEKNLSAFLRCARKLKHKNWRFVISTPTAPPAIATDNVEVIVHPNKESYYDLLRHSKIVYSSAHQETFGYAINEAIACGCSVVAPDRLSYPEVLEHDRKFLYSEDDPDGAALLECRMDKHEIVPFKYTDKYSYSTIRFLKRIVPS
jgi:glycosyltransferase involved in cell wall biosynthesis